MCLRSELVLPEQSGAPEAAAPGPAKRSGRPRARSQKAKRTKPAASGHCEAERQTRVRSHESQAHRSPRLLVTAKRSEQTSCQKPGKPSEAERAEARGFSTSGTGRADLVQEAISDKGSEASRALKPAASPTQQPERADVQKPFRIRGQKRSGARPRLLTSGASRPHARSHGREGQLCHESRAPARSAWLRSRRTGAPKPRKEQSGARGSPRLLVTAKRAADLMPEAMDEKGQLCHESGARLEARGFWSLLTLSDAVSVGSDQKPVMRLVRSVRLVRIVSDGCHCCI